MKESETDEILFSNISYLKQFRLNKMGAEVVISDRFLISKFLKGLTHCALDKERVKLELWIERGWVHIDIPNPNFFSDKPKVPALYCVPYLH